MSSSSSSSSSLFVSILTPPPPPTLRKTAPSGPGSPFPWDALRPGLGAPGRRGRQPPGSGREPPARPRSRSGPGRGPSRPRRRRRDVKTPGNSPKTLRSPPRLSGGLQRPGSDASYPTTAPRPEPGTAPATPPARRHCSRLPSAAAAAVFPPAAAALDGRNADAHALAPRPPPPRSGGAGRGAREGGAGGVGRAALHRPAVTWPPPPHRGNLGASPGRALASGGLGRGGSRFAASRRVVSEGGEGGRGVRERGQALPSLNPAAAGERGGVFPAGKGASGGAWLWGKGRCSAAAGPTRCWRRRFPQRGRTGLPARSRWPCAASSGKVGISTRAGAAACLVCAGGLRCWRPPRRREGLRAGAALTGVGSAAEEAGFSSLSWAFVPPILNCVYI